MSDWEAQPSGFTATPGASVNFRLKSDQTPAQSGFSVNVMDNPKSLTLKEWLRQNPDNGSLFPAVTGVTETFITVNGISWEQFTSGSVGTVPSGHVLFAAVHSGKLYYVTNIDESPQTASAAAAAVQTFRFTAL